MVVVVTCWFGAALNGMITSPAGTATSTLAGDLHDHGQDTPLGQRARSCRVDIASVPVPGGHRFAAISEVTSV